MSKKKKKIWRPSLAMCSKQNVAINSHVNVLTREWCSYLGGMGAYLFSNRRPFWHVRGKP